MSYKYTKLLSNNYKYWFRNIHTGYLNIMKRNLTDLYVTSDSHSIYSNTDKQRYCSLKFHERYREASSRRSRERDHVGGDDLPA